MDLWPVVGAKLGFTQFPGSDTEPARSGPGVAQHLENIYRRYLLQFDMMFVSSILKMKPQANNTGNAGQPGPSNVGQQTPLVSAAGPTNAPSLNAMSGGVMPNNASSSNAMSASNSTFPAGLDPNKINELVSYARRSAEELRRQGIPEPIINTVERNRPLLEESLRYQQEFHGGITATQAQPSSNGTMGPVQGLQANMPPGFMKTPQMNPAVPRPSASPAQPMPPQVLPPQMSQPSNGNAPMQVQAAINIPPKPFVAVSRGNWPTPDEMRAATAWLDAVRAHFMATRGMLESLYPVVARLMGYLRPPSDAVRQHS